MDLSARVDNANFEINEMVLEKPIVQAYFGIDDGISNVYSDKGLVEKRELFNIKSKTVEQSNQSAGASNLVLEQDDAEASIVANNCVLRAQYSTTNFFSYPHMGLPGMLKRHRLESRGQNVKTIEDNDNVYLRVEAMKQLFYSNTNRSQHADMLDGSLWSTPVDVTTAWGTAAIAGTNLTVSGAHGLTTDDIGGIFELTSASTANQSLKVVSITSATVIVVAAANPSVAIDTGAAGVVSVLRYFPALAGQGESGTISVHLSDMQERAMGWVANKTPVLYTPFIWSGYLGVSALRHMWLTGGLRHTFDLCANEVALYNPFENAGAFALTSLSVDVEQWTLSQQGMQSVDALMADLADDPTSYGPVLHTDCYDMMYQEIDDANTKFQHVYDQQHTNVDSLICFRQPVSVESAINERTNAQENKELKRFLMKYTKKNYEYIRREHGDAVSLFESLYRETENHHEKSWDGLNLLEHKAKPWVPLNLQQLNVSDDYTGLATNSTDKINLQYEYDTAPNAGNYRHWIIANYKKRLVIGHDAATGRFYIDTVRD